MVMLGSGIAGDLFVPFMFVMFNAGDLVGRALAGCGPWSRQPPSTAALSAYAIARLLLLVAMLFCNVVLPHRWALPVLFRWSALLPVALTYA